MSSNTTANLAGLTPAECYRLLLEHRQKWLVPTAVCSILALGYALVMTRYWEATQGLVVRQEASASATKDPGKFADLYEMRTFQETILELAKSKQVITATLNAVDQSMVVPSAEDIEKLRKRLRLLPPGGAEFGKTEVCYLQVKDTDRERAIKLVVELGEQLDIRLRRFREEKSQSLSKELNQRVVRAQAALDLETARLAEFEAKVGADLGELRMLNASFSGQSDLRQQAINLNSERRDATMKVNQSEQLLDVLRAARREPEQLIAMPNSLLVSQPTLRRLKDGLVDAQLRLARLEGTRTSQHPQVLAAVQSVQYIREDLHKELAVAIRGVEVELKLGKDRVANLQKQHDGVQQRLGRLAQLRADYANRTAAVENSRKVLDQAQKQLGEVSATLVAANSASLVTPIDQPETGPYPAGIGRSSVVLLGTFSGFAMGLGWLFLTVVPAPVERDAPTASDSKSFETKPAAVTPVPRKIPSSLPPAIAARVADILAARSTNGTAELNS